MECRSWLTDAETVLTKHNHASVSRLAGLRAVLDTAREGVFDQSYTIDSRLSRRKASAAVAALCLHEAQDTLHGLLGPLMEKQEEALSLLRQVIAHADQLGLLHEYYGGDPPGGGDVTLLWKRLAGNSEIRPALNRVLAEVLYAEALRILTAALEAWPHEVLNGGTG